MRRRGPRKDLDRPVPWRRLLPWIAMLPVGVAVQWLASWRPDLVERFYSEGIYPIIAEFIGTITGWFGFALAEFLILGLILVILVKVWRGIGRVFRRRTRSLTNLLVHGAASTLALAGFLYSGALLTWGLNHQRQPFAETAGLTVTTPTADDLREVATALIAETAELRMQVEEDSRGWMQLRRDGGDPLKRATMGFDRIGLRYPFLNGRYVSRPKRLYASPLLSATGVGGIYLMLTGEPSVNRMPPDASLASAACHEMAHQTGWAREEEASFVGYVACSMNPDVGYRYAAAFMALRRVLGALARADQAAYEELRGTLHDGVRRDWEASSNFWHSHRTRLTAVASRANDVYLKSQGHEAGVESYGLVVDLLVADYRLRQRVGGD